MPRDRFGSEVPRQQLLDSTNGMISYARENIPRIAFSVEPIQFGRSDQSYRASYKGWQRALPGIGAGEY